MTLNINGIMQPSRLGMLEYFLRGHDVGIALLQEVTSPMLNVIQLYKPYLNTGTDQRGTAILTKNGITITNVKRLPSGRGIAALFQRTWIINEYAPSGADRCQGPLLY
jgi:exonuclease III